MEVSVKWLYDRIDGHEPALVISGFKHAHCVVMGRPIRVYQIDVRKAKDLRPVDKDGRPYSAVAFAKDYLSKNRSHGITQAARRLCEMVIANEGKPIVTNEELPDNPDVELQKIDEAARSERASKRKSPSEVKEELNAKADKESGRLTVMEDGLKKMFGGKKKKRAEVLAEREEQRKKDGISRTNTQTFDPKPKQQGSLRAGSLVGTIASELGIDPKDARKKLRAKGMHAPYHDAAAIRAVLSPPS